MSAEERVLESLGDRAIHTIGGLAFGLDLPRRTVEEAVEELRLRGEPIVASADGIRFTENVDELATYLEARGHRAAAIHRGTMAMRDTLRRLRGVTQGELFPVQS